MVITIQQRIHINRKGINSIEIDAADVTIPLAPGGETTFELLITNYGTPMHVHISASEELRNIVSFTQENPYIRYEERTPIIVRLPKDGQPYRKGSIFITTGYGAQKSSFILKVGDFGISDSDERSTRSPVASTTMTKGAPKTQTLKKPAAKRPGFGLQLNMEMIAIPSIAVMIMLASLAVALTATRDVAFTGALASSVSFIFLMIYGLMKELNM